MQSERPGIRREQQAPSHSGWENFYPAAATATAAAGERVFTAERLLLTRMLRSLGNPPLTLVLWNGEEIVGRNDTSATRKVFIKSRAALLKLVSQPEYWFCELYVDRLVDVSGDLVEFFESLYRAMLPANSTNGVMKLLARFSDTRRNSIEQSRQNIHHHYDIGNDFYKLWLDEQMLYTCAYFPDQAMTLEAAQTAKMDHVCRKLWLKPGDTVVEAGCGWGALAMHMARNYGVNVKAFNISKEQLAYARERARSEGLAGKVEFIEDDYRNVSGKFDAFASVGMLEHVGPHNYPELGTVIRKCLNTTGRGLIHSIGRDSPEPLNSWIERRIFPGAHPPSLSQMMQIFEPMGLSVLDVENLRLHYARTLEHWMMRYEAKTDRVAEMFDAEFVRAWRVYLAGSLAAFRSGDMQLFQVVFTHSGCNDIPWSRRQQYQS